LENFARFSISNNWEKRKKEKKKNPEVSIEILQMEQAHSLFKHKIIIIII